MDTHNGIVLSLLEEVKKELTTQVKSVARLEALNEARQETLQSIAKNIEDIKLTDSLQSREINEIKHKTDSIQKEINNLNKDLSDHLSLHVRMDEKNKENSKDALATFLDNNSKQLKTKKEYYLKLAEKIIPYVLGTSGILAAILQAKGYIKLYIPLL
jgi:uncharacterized sporulation protein YeaH/YhbH (DUF444 family)